MLFVARLLSGLVLLLIVGGGLREQPWPQLFTDFDKFLHFGSFFALTLLLLLTSTERLRGWLLLLVILLGAALELGQDYWLPKRQADWWDIAANTLGVVLAFALNRLYLFWRRLKS